MVTFYSKINGTTFRNSGNMMRHLKKDDQLMLVREPENEHDKNAIKVYMKDFLQPELVRHHIGYIPKATAGGLVKVMDEGKEVKCLVSEITGGTEGKENYGCNILIEYEG